jgi:hypothetical protein
VEKAAFESVVRFLRLHANAPMQDIPKVSKKEGREEGRVGGLDEKGREEGNEGVRLLCREKKRVGRRRRRRRSRSKKGGRQRKRHDEVLTSSMSRMKYSHTLPASLPPSLPAHHPVQPERGGARGIQ